MKRIIIILTLTIGTFNLYSQDRGIANIKISLDKINHNVAQSIEGTNYVFTGFDVRSNQELAIIGSYTNGNYYSIIDLINKKLTQRVQLHDTPLELICAGDYSYIVCFKKVYILKGANIVANYEHGIQNIFNFDRLLEIDNKIFLSMSNGSAYKINLSEAKYVKKLQLNSESIWVEKINNHEFVVEKGNKEYKYNTTLKSGAMTILALNNNEIICLTEEVVQEKPLEVQRLISSTKDNFISKFMIRGNNHSFFLKNDLRIKKHNIYQLEVNFKEIILSINNI